MTPTERQLRDCSTSVRFAVRLLNITTPGTLEHALAGHKVSKAISEYDRIAVPAGLPSYDGFWRGRIG